MLRIGRAIVMSGLLLATYYSSPAHLRESSREPSLVSIVRLLATPEVFDGKLVRVAGYCHLQFEGDALYLHREDYVFRLPINAVRLDLGDRSRDTFQGTTGHYALVEGTFLKADPRDPRPYGGVVRVQSIEVLPPRVP